MPNRLPRQRPHQRGAAIITALLVVMLAATIATYLLAQQSRALTRTARATERAQVTLYAEPTLDWARAVLFQGRNDTRTALTDPWAQPIAAQPLFNADGSSSVFASGLMHDETGKFNLNNLVKDDRTASQDDIDIFKRLLKNLKLNPDLSDAVVDWLDKDSDTRPNGAEDGYYMNLAVPYRTANQPMVQWQELARVRGFDAAIMRRLAPFVTALPKRTKINVNTAPIEVIAALSDDISGEDAAMLVRSRETLPFLTNDDVIQYVPSLKKTWPTISPYVGFKSDYFSVTIAITGEAAAAHQTALLERPQSTPAGWPRIIWVQAQ